MILVLLLRPIDKIDADNLIIIIVSKYLSIISISVQWTLRRLVERKLSFEKLRALVTNRLSLIGKNILLLGKSALVAILVEGSCTRILIQILRMFRSSLFPL